MDVVSSTPLSLWIDFEGPEGLMIPTTGRTSYSLYDGSGSPLAVDQVLTPAAEATGVSIPILAINNILDDDKLFERRVVQLVWEFEGQTYSARRTYRVIQLPTYGVVAEDVRRYLALNSDELRDDEIDLFSAWVTLSGTVPGFEAALNAGNRSAMRAERALVLSAASLLFPSLRYRIAQAKTDGPLKFERLRDPAAFGDLVATTERELLEITREITGDVAAQSVVPTLLRLGTVTIDPVTGVAPVTGA